MLSVPGRTNPEGQIGDLLEFGVEPSVGKGYADLGGGEEALRGSHGRGKIGVPRHDHKGVAGSEVQKFDGLHPQGDVGLLFFMALDSRSAARTGEVFALEAGDMEMDSTRSQGFQMLFMAVDGAGIIPVAVERERGEEMDLFEDCLPPEHAEVRSQELFDVKPAEVGNPQDRFGLADGEFQIKPVNQKGHPAYHGAFPARKNPPGRDPRGPGEPRWTARGGNEKRSAETGLKSRVTFGESAPRRPNAIPGSVLPIINSWRSDFGCHSETKLSRAGGHPHSLLSRSGLARTMPRGRAGTPESG